MKKRLLITGIFDSNTEETLSDCGIILVRYLEKTHTLEIHCRYKNEAITTSSDIDMIFLKALKSKDGIKGLLKLILEDVFTKYAGKKQCDELYVTECFKFIMLSEFNYLFDDTKN